MPRGSPGRLVTQRRAADGNDPRGRSPDPAVAKESQSFLPEWLIRGDRWSRVCEPASVEHADGLVGDLDKYRCHAVPR